MYRFRNWWYGWVSVLIKTYFEAILCCPFWRRRDFCLNRFHYVSSNLDLEGDPSTDFLSLVVELTRLLPLKSGVLLLNSVIDKIAQGKSWNKGETISHREITRMRLEGNATPTATKLKNWITIQYSGPYHCSKWSQNFVLKNSDWPEKTKETHPSKRP